MTRTLTVRVADLFPVDAHTAREAARRTVPAPITTYVAGTGAGTVVTLESRLRGRAAWRRAYAVRRLRTVLGAMDTELESAQRTSGRDPDASRGGRA